MSINKVINIDDEVLFYDRVMIGSSFQGYEDLGIMLSISQISEYNKDPDLFVARYLGVTKEVYLDWFNNCQPVDRGYRPSLHHEHAPCMAMTKKGTPCKIETQEILTMQDWFDGIRGYYCQIHKENTNR